MCTLQSSTRSQAVIDAPTRPRLHSLLVTYLLLLLLPNENRVVRLGKNDESKSERMSGRGISIRV